MRHILHQGIGAVIVLDPDDIYIDMETAEELTTKLSLARTELCNPEGDRTRAIELVEEVYDFCVRRLIRFHQEKPPRLPCVDNMTEAAFPQTSEAK